MALRQNMSVPAVVTTSAGTFSSKENTTFDMGSCYIKVTDYSNEGSSYVDEGVKVAASLRFTVEIKNDDGKIANQTFIFTPSVADGSKNFIAQAYDYLKTLPEFAGATDV